MFVTTSRIAPSADVAASVVVSETALSVGVSERPLHAAQRTSVHEASRSRGGRCMAPFVAIDRQAFTARGYRVTSGARVVTEIVGSGDGIYSLTFRRLAIRRAATGTKAEPGCSGLMAKRALWSGR